MSAGSRWLLWEWAHREERQQAGRELGLDKPDEMCYHRVVTGRKTPTASGTAADMSRTARLPLWAGLAENAYTSTYAGFPDAGPGHKRSFCVSRGGDYGLYGRDLGRHHPGQCVVHALREYREETTEWMTVG